MFKRCFAFFLFIWATVVVTVVAADQEPYDSIIDSARKRCVPDKRVSLFEATITRQPDRALLVKGKTTSAEAKQELFRQVQSGGYRSVDSLEVWPFASLGEAVYGVVNLSAVCISTKPEFGAEMSTQALLGMPVRILDNDDWVRIQTPDRYIGWITSGGVVPMNRVQYRAWLSAPKVIFVACYGNSYERPDVRAATVSDLVCGNVLRKLGEKGSFYRVSYPDGRQAYVRKSDAKPVEQWQNKIRLTPESILQAARSLLGVPYVWGGTSSKGVDCSGLIKVVTFMHGLILQRDASQLAQTGRPVDITQNYDRLQAGDLLFFGRAAGAGRGEQVSHVAFYLGDRRFIHSSTCVRISSLDPASPAYDAFNTGRLIKAVRFLDAVGTPGIERIDQNDFYQLPK